MKTEKIKFDKIGKSIAEELENVRDIYLDVFESEGYKQVYIVVEFVGGAISVRNARANSLTLNIEELSKMLNGGYYKEVKEYRSLKLNENLFSVELWDTATKDWQLYDYPQGETVASYADWCVGERNVFWVTVNGPDDVIRLNGWYIVNGSDYFYRIK